MALQSAAVFDAIRAAIEKEGADLVKKVNAIYQFNIKTAGGEKSWLVDLKNGSGSVSEGTGKADTTLTVADADFANMAAGKLDSQMAFMQGKLKIAGSIGHAMKLNGLMQKAAELAKAAPAAAPKAAAAPAASAAPAGDSGFKSDKIFDLMSKKIGAQGAQFVDKVKAVYQFNITGGPGGATKTWLVDLKNGSGKVSEGAGKADTTLTVSDADFVAMNTGKLDSQMAFMQGKLKIAGSMGHAMKLGGILSQVSAM